ncbi:MAG: membrane protein [Firmicutes bacterium]|jgi:uncharacterized membrane protein YczE|nr:membrane protein [Bacillota bacterium]
MGGLFLFSLGLFLTIQANLGVSPWDAFHLGVVNHSSLTIGRVSQLTGLSLIILCTLLKEKPGWGTLANMYFVGLFLDLLNGAGVIPQARDLWVGLAMLLGGTGLIGWGSFFYLNAGLGSGPRDGLMMALNRILGIEIWKARMAIEVSALVVGRLLGGPVGLGTAITAFCIGPSVQLAYAIAKREPSAISHRTLADDYRALKARAAGRGLS